MIKFTPPIENFRFQGNISQLFGVNKSAYEQFRNSKGEKLGGHNGLDIFAENDQLGYGTLIKAMHDWDTCSLESDFPIKTRGNGIRLYKHMTPFLVDGVMCHMIETIYWHLADFEIKAGSSGKQGETIGKMGNTGQVFPKPSNTCALCPYFGTHLHTAWRGYDKNGKIIDNDFDGYRDPVPFLFQEGDRLPVIFNRDMYPGVSGNDVAWLQTVLKLEGFGEDYEPLGYFGSKTLRDVIKLQKKHSISPALGFVGPKTRSYLNNKYN